MMKTMPSPCADWTEQLAVVFPADLSPADQAALNAHLATCPACAAMKADYQWMDARIRALPAPRPLPDLPPRLLRLWAEEDRRARLNNAPLRFPAREDGMQTLEHPDTRTPAPTPSATHERRHLPRLVSTLSAAATVALVVLVVAVLFASRTSAPVAGRQWVKIPHLTNTPALPLLAPSNPRFVYRVNKLLTDALGEPQLQHSPDEGATWQTLDMPTLTPGVVILAESVQPSIFINPLNADMVFLTLPRFDFDATAPDQCPSPGQFYKHPCTLQYYSMDDGEDWYLLHLPLPGVLGDPTFFDNPSLELFASQRVLRAQGKRLYSAIGAYNQGGVLLGSSGARLVTSTDGGMTWQVADKPLADQGQFVCDYQPAPTGSTIFAITGSGVCGGSPTYLWRSDDAGKHWTRVSVLPNLSERGLSVVSRGNGAQPLLYLSTQDLGAQVDKAGILQVSTDGGKTWAAAPNPDPTDGRSFLGPLGVLGDGSVIVASSPVLGKGTPTFIAWKTGERAWHQAAPPVDYMTYLLVAPDAAGGNGTLWLVSSQENNTYNVYRY